MRSRNTRPSLTPVTFSSLLMLLPKAIFRISESLCLTDPVHPHPLGRPDLPQAPAPLFLYKIKAAQLALTFLSKRQI